MRQKTALAILCALAAAPAAAKPKLPPCPPKGPQLFVAPMGEPFRAGPDDHYPVAAWFGKADADRDGRLTRTEFVADAEMFFRALDVDHDGEITPGEVIRYEHDIAPEIRLYARGPRPGDAARAKKRKRAKDQPAYGSPLGAGRWGLINTPEPVISADADFNRGITFDEFRAAASARFDILDKAKAGALTLAILPLTPAQAAMTNCIPQPAVIAPPQPGQPQKDRPQESRR